MSSSKHTPGDWTIRELTRNGIGNFLIDAPTAPGGIAITVGGLGDEEPANARLIVAAPDLLEALEACREGIDILLARIIEAAPRDADPATYHPSKSGQPWAAFLMASCAIKKARGEYSPIPPTDVECPFCGAPVGVPCVDPPIYAPAIVAHKSRSMASKLQPYVTAFSGQPATEAVSRSEGSNE